jgi:hypothetical protein
MKMTQGQFYTDIFSGIINQYLLKFREEERLYRSANILLIVAGVYGFSYFTLGVHNFNNIQFISFLPLLIVYGYSIYFIATPPSIWPWISNQRLQQLQRNNDSEQVFKSLTNQIFQLAGDVDSILRKYLKFIWWNIYFLSLSILWTYIIYFIHEEYTILFIILLPLSYILGVVYYLYYKMLIQRLAERWANMNQ